MNKWILSITLLLLPGYALAVDNGQPTEYGSLLENEKTILFDRYNSMYAGTSFILSTRLFLDDVERHFIPQKYMDKWWVLGGTALVDCIINYYLMDLYIKIFGYGFRIRSLDGPTNYYVFNSSNSIDDIYSKFWLNHKKDQAILTTIASSEAIGLLAQEINFNLIKLKPVPGGRKVVPGGLILYILSNLSSMGIGGAVGFHDDKEIDKETGYPIWDYIYYMNRKHGIKQISGSDFNKALLILIPDFVGMYLVGSKKEKKINQQEDALEPNKLVYLPRFNAHLTPFGISYGMDNYFRIQERAFLVGFKLGKSPFYSHYYGGIDCRTDGLYKYQNYQLDLTASLWYQPKLLLKKTDVLENKNYLGCLLGTHHKWKINSYFALCGALLYKTAGFLAGRVPEGGWIWQIGLSINY